MSNLSPSQLHLSKIVSSIALITSCGFTIADQLPASAASLAPVNVSIVDGDFANWKVFHFITDDPFTWGPNPNLSTGSGQPLQTGGVPGTFLQLNHNIVLGDTSWIGGIKTDASYNPITDGEILSLSVNANVKSLGGVSAWQVVIEQSGKRYFSFPFGTISAGSGNWQSVNISNLTAQNFDTNPWSGVSLQSSNINSPNFGAGAAPIYFGFMFGNRIVGASGSNTFGLDNFALTINAGAPSSNVSPPVTDVNPPATDVPEPASILGMILAGVGFACLKRSRSA